MYDFPFCENKASELDIDVSLPTAIGDGTGNNYTFAIPNIEETRAEYLAQRQNYGTNPSTGRLYREFSGPMKVVIPKGKAVDNYGNDSEQFEVDLGIIDALKPEIIKAISGGAFTYPAHNNAINKIATIGIINMSTLSFSFVIFY